MRKSAKIIFFNKQDGGRSSSPVSGYKPQIKIGEDFTSCSITPKESSISVMDFGIEYDVYIELQFAELYLEGITECMKINLYEGNRLVGEGHFLD